MVEMILEVDALTVRREGVIAVEDVSFSLAPQTDTALVGPNGAGKSSLVKALLGLIPHQGGSVHLLGQRLGPQGQLPPAVRAQVAYMPQTFAVPPRFPLSVAEFVALGWDGPRRPRGAVAEALAKVTATALAERLLSELSGGEIQRVLLAFCLVRPRRLLVLDEAQAGLDAQGAERFYLLLQELRRREGLTILQVSHDLEMVRRSCDRVLCLNRRLRCSGPPDHALSAGQLELVYGKGYGPYHHHHH